MPQFWLPSLLANRNCSSCDEPLRCLLLSAHVFSTAPCKSSKEKSWDEVDTSILFLDSRSKRKTHRYGWFAKTGFSFRDFVANVHDYLAIVPSFQHHMKIGTGVQPFKTALVCASTCGPKQRLIQVKNIWNIQLKARSSFQCKPEHVRGWVTSLAWKRFGLWASFQLNQKAFITVKNTIIIDQYLKIIIINITVYSNNVFNICVMYIYMYITYILHLYLYMCMCICVSVYVYMCICVYVYVYMYICIYVYMYICIYVYMYICIYVYMYTCIHVYMYICIYVYMYICLYVYMSICLYAYMYICIYVYTYIRIYVYRYIGMCVYVYMCICVYVYICIHVYMYTCIHVYMYICIYVYMYNMYICLYVYMCICLYVYMSICIYVYMCICVYMYMCIYVYVYICICICICICI